MAHNLFIRALLRLVAALTLSAAMLSSAAPLEKWHWRSPLPQGNPLRGVAYGNGLYVAVGDLGTILTSPDGMNWVRQSSGTTSALRDCVFGDGQWVVVGDFGTVLTSSDARAWTTEYASTFFSLNAVTYGNGQFVAVGNGTTIITSPDGMNWALRSSGPLDLFDIIYEEGVYVVVGRTANFAGVILNSTDGASWRRNSVNINGAVVSLAHGGGTFAAVARQIDQPTPALWISDDGYSWQGRDIDVRRWPDSRLGFGNGTWVLAGSYTSMGFGEGAIAISTNLQTWVEVLSNSAPVSAISHQADQFMVSRTDGSLLTSRDGHDWNSAQRDYSRVTLADAQYANGGWLAVSYDAVLGSPDGITWTNIASFTDADLRSVAYGNGTCVVASSWRVWTSTDMATWTNVSAGLSDSLSIADIVHGDGRFVAISGSSGGAFISRDGINWSQAWLTEPDAYLPLLSITYANGRFVAVGHECLAASPDGMNWQLITNENVGMRAVTWGNGRFVAVGRNGSMTSIDGTNWVGQGVPQFGSYALAYGNGFFVAVGFEANSESPIWVSQDGLNWSRRSSHTSRSLSTVAFGDGKFLIAGFGGVLLESDPVVTLNVQPGSPTRLVLHGPSRRSYRFEKADSAEGIWTDLGTVSMENAPVLFSDPQPAPTGSRFYRALLLP